MPQRFHLRDDGLLFRRLQQAVIVLRRNIAVERSHTPRLLRRFIHIPHSGIFISNAQQCAYMRPNKIRHTRVPNLLIREQHIELFEISKITYREAFAGHRGKFFRQQTQQLRAIIRSVFPHCSCSTIRRPIFQ